MTRIAYVISAYKLPSQLVRLVRRLAAPGASFAIHVDRKSPRRVFDEMVAGTHDLPVAFVPRHVSHWGGFGHVRATLAGLEHLRREQIPFDYVVLLTGQDYPLRHPAGIASVLEASGGRSFISWWPLPRPAWGRRGGLDRVEDWHLVTYRRLHLALALQRRIPGGLTPFGGAPYWCLPKAAIDYVEATVAERPELVRFFEHVFIPDELFFQTLIMNSPLRETVENENLRYLDWTRTPAPAVLGVGDLDAMLASGKLFARKFDETIDARVLDELDRVLDRDAGQA
jgi:hypothetical protein